MSWGNKQQWILAKRPKGVPDPSEVVFQEAPIPETPAEMVQSTPPGRCHLSLAPLRSSSTSHLCCVGLTDNHGRHWRVSDPLAHAECGCEYAWTAVQRKNVIGSR